MSDTWIDFVREKIAEERQARKWAWEDYCNKDCDCHNESCIYYDSEQETYDYEQCFKDRGC